MFTSFTTPPALVSTENVSAYLAPPRISDIVNIAHSSVNAESQNTSIRMECSVEFAMASSRTALLSIGYHVLQIGHYRLLACKNGTSNTFDLSFCKVGRNDTEIVFTQLQSAES